MSEQAEPTGGGSTQVTRLDGPVARGGPGSGGPGGGGAGGGGVGGGVEGGGGLSSGAGAAASGAPTHLTPADALARDEAARLLIFVKFIFLLCGILVPSLWVLGGDPLARDVMLGGAGLAFVSGGVTMIALRRHPEQLVAYHFAFGMTCVVIMTAAFYYFGPMSPALVVVTFGAFIFAVGQSFKGAALITFVLIAVHLALTLSTIFGVIEDRGLFRPVSMSVAGQLVALLLVNVIFVGTFVMARMIRKNAAQSLEDLHRAARDVAQREMLLAEARQDLFAALQVGGPGRYTDQVLGRWRLGVLLGRGGMGEVYAATAVDSSETCAIKLLHPHLVAEATHFERFRREAELSMQLRSPHIVRVLEVSRAGETPPYLVMERLEGYDLSTRLKQKARLTNDETLEMLRQIADGLGVAHAAGIVHRDLKPQNIFRSGGEAARPVRWKVLDFGASTLQDSRGTLTAGAVIGTPSYMSPEQARGETVDARADIYALAVITYRALTGTPAFPAGDLPAVLFAVQNRLPPRPSELVQLPPQLDDVLLVGMAKEADRRFGSADELVSHVTEALAGRIDPDVRARAWLLSERWPWGAAAG